jgi:hypothetical protein
MVAMLMRDHNGIDLVGLDTCTAKPPPRLAQTEAAIDQDPRDPNAIATFNDERITVAAATQAREPHAGAGALATIESANKD